VRNFLWRLAKLILPTRGRLEKKGVTLETICPLVQQVWFSSPLGLHIPHDVSLLSWMQSWLKRPNIYAAQLFGITLWKFWRGRNMLYFVAGYVSFVLCFDEE